MDATLFGWQLIFKRKKTGFACGMEFVYSKMKRLLASGFKTVWLRTGHKAGPFFGRQAAFLLNSKGAVLPAGLQVVVEIDR